MNGRNIPDVRHLMSLAATTESTPMGKYVKIQYGLYILNEEENKTTQVTRHYDVIDQGFP